MVPEGTTEIAKAAFSGSQLTSVTIPLSVEYIAEEALMDSNIETINICGPEDCIEGAPWGADEDTVVINWNYKEAEKQ